MARRLDVGGLERLCRLLVPYQWEPADDVFWTGELRVALERVQLDLQDVTEDGLLAKRLQTSSHTRLATLWLAQTLGISTEGLNVTQIKAAVRAWCAANQPLPPWVVAVLLIHQYAEGKRRDNLLALMRRELTDEQLHACGFDPEDTDPSVDRALACLFLYQHKRDVLPILAYADIGERVGYRSCVLDKFVPENGCEDRSLLTRTDALLAEGDGELLDALTVNRVSEALQCIESHQRSRKRVRCVCADIDGERRIFYIRRDLRPAEISEVDRSLFGTESQVVILQFSDGLRRADASATDDPAAETIATRLVQELTGIPYLHYLPPAPFTPQATFLDFMRRVRDHDMLPYQEPDATLRRLRISEVYLSRAPMQGTPALLLRSVEDEHLGQALRAMSGQYMLDVLAEADRMRSVKLRLLRPRNPVKYNGFMLRLFAEREGQLRIYYSATTNTHRSIRREFEELLRGHGIKATSIAKSTAAQASIS